jgi:hypothetical protein
VYPTTTAVWQNMSHDTTAQPVAPVSAVRHHMIVFAVYSVVSCNSDSSMYLHETSASASRDDEIRLKPQVQVRVLEYALTQPYQLQCAHLHIHISSK